MSNSSCSYGLKYIRSIISEIAPPTNSAIDLVQILSENNIRYREHDIGFDSHGEQILGACKADGLRRLIVISPSITNNSRKRFTIAHEVGHIFLHHGNKACLATDFHLWDDKYSKEIEANTFAAELLLPFGIIKEEILKSDVNFEIIDRLSNRFETSLFTTTINLVKADVGMSAAILHDGKRTIWVVKSLTLKNKIDNSCINPVWCTNANANLQTTKVNVNPNVWLKDCDNTLKCTEETRYLSLMNKYLTILTFREC